MTDPFAPTELDVEGTYFDPRYMLELKRKSEVGLWFWSDWRIAMMYSDQIFRTAAVGLTP
jgi:hypothetical protein